MSTITLNAERPRLSMRPRGRCGFTIIECAIAMVLIGGLLVSVLRIVGTVAKGRIVLVNHRQAADLASQMMSEVMQAHYVEPSDDPPVFGLESGELNGLVRTAYDDVDDYNNWVASPPVARDGTPLTEFTGWTRTVKIDRVATGNPNVVIGGDLGLKRIQVKVTDPLGQVNSFVSLRASTSVYESQAGQDTDFVTQIEAQLQIGADGPVSHAGINLLNRVLDTN